MVMVGVLPRMVSGMISAGMPPCAMVRPCGSGTSGYGDGRRTHSQRDETKRPAERKQLNHSLSSMTHPQSRRVGAMTNAAPGLNFSLWREEDFMRQCGNNFGVIPRSFRGEKESSLPHCGRAH
jgi:hypothetical protein